MDSLWFNQFLSQPSQVKSKYVLVLLFYTQNDALKAFDRVLRPVKSLDDVHATAVEKLDSDIFALKISIECGSFSQADERQLRVTVTNSIGEEPVDFFLSTHAFYHTPRGFAAFDMDSCILAHECIDELATEMGVSQRVSEITRRAMAGEIDFDTALRERVSLLRGMDASALDKVWRRLYLNPGAKELITSLKKAGFKIALVSGGFVFFTQHVAERLGIDYAFSNTLEVIDGKLTGHVAGRVVNGYVKEKIVRILAEKEGLPMNSVISMGDGANDQFMVRAAGVGIAYHAKAVLKAVTPHHINNFPLHALLHYLNVPLHRTDHDPVQPILAHSLPSITSPCSSLDQLLGS